MGAAGGTTYFMVKGKRYDMPREMTGREFRFIKNETGVRAGEIEAELEGGDTDLMLALVVVAMRRDGNPGVEIEDVIDLRIGSEDGIQVFAEGDEEAERPTEGVADDQEEPPKAPPAKTGRRRSATSSASSPGKSRT